MLDKTKLDTAHLLGDVMLYKLTNLDYADIAQLREMEKLVASTLEYICQVIAEDMIDSKGTP